MIFMPLFHSAHRREFSSFALMFVLMYDTFQMIRQRFSNIHAKTEIGVESPETWSPSGGFGFFLTMTVDIP
jgi:hypothetical protein